MQGINEYRLAHMLGVARRCYELAKEEGWNEYTARKLFLIGYLHDIGYEFSDKGENHGEIANDMIESVFGVSNYAIKEHGKVDTKLSDPELVILNKANLTVNSLGRKCSIYNRLFDIKARYGKESAQYINALTLAKKLELVDEDFGKEREQVQLNSNGVNANIKYNILDDAKMKEIGFTENREGYLFFSRKIEFTPKSKYKRLDVTFNVTIPRDGSDIRIDVLDEDYCQPYDYQYMLENNPESEPALIVYKQVEKWMKYLADNGVITGHKPGEYI